MVIFTHDMLRRQYTEQHAVPQHAVCRHDGRVTTTPAAGTNMVAAVTAGEKSCPATPYSMVVSAKNGGCRRQIEYEKNTPTRQKDRIVDGGT